MRPRLPKDFVDEPFSYHQEVVVDISALTNLGSGLGRVDGWVVMVPYALPGEKVRARVWRNKKNYSEADLIEILEPSVDRVEPGCPLFGECGGCQYQHLDYAAQLRWKKSQVEDLLEKIAGLEEPVVQPVRASPQKYGYRSKITPHFQKKREGKPLNIGFLRAASRSIVDVPQCPIATDAINEALPQERESVLSGRRKFRKGATLLLRDSYDGVATDPKKIISQKVGSLLFQVQAGEFFQNNPFILPEMVDYVINEARGDGIRFLVDAYCGVGVFSLSASPYFEKLAGVEINPQAINLANANTVLNKVENCQFTIGEAETLFSSIDFDPECTSVIIDPPRKGCGNHFLELLAAYGPKKIIYVSCDPATQARDLKLLANSGYKLKKMQPFDLFPQTRHIETIATLGKS